jgi:hypothetical protein
MSGCLLGIGAALGLGLQVIVVAGTTPASLLAAVALSSAAWQVWRYRFWLGAHVDMIVLMSGYGGLGMLQAGPHCHTTIKGWLEMTTGMLVLGLAPVLGGSRCVEAALRRGHLTRTLLFDTLGMVAGMGAIQPSVYLVSAHPALRHFGMVFGMAAGMIAGSLAAAKYFRFKDQQFEFRYVSKSAVASAAPETAIPS